MIHCDACDLHFEDSIEFARHWRAQHAPASVDVKPTDLAAEGKCIAAICQLLADQPEHSIPRVWNVITDLINPNSGYKSNLQHLAELDTKD